MFKVIDGTSSDYDYAGYHAETAGYGLNASIRKWREAYYLIRRNYEIFLMDNVCGLCNEFKSCVSCPLKTKGFCNDIQFHYLPIKKDIVEIRTKLKVLRKLLKEEKDKTNVS
jgi:hypothetical protein